MNFFDCKLIELQTNGVTVYLTAETARGLIYFSFLVNSDGWMCGIPRDSKTVMRLVFGLEGHFKKFSVVPFSPWQCTELPITTLDIQRRAQMICSNSSAYYYLFDRIRTEYPTSVCGELVDGVMDVKNGEFIVQRVLGMPLNPRAIIGPAVNSPVYRNVFDVILPMPIAEEIKEYMPVIPYILS